MKIALMTNNYKPFIAGVPVSVERLAEALRGGGHEVTVFAPTYERQEKEPGVFRYKTIHKNFIGGAALPHPFDRRIVEEFKRERFDVIHVQHPFIIGWTAAYLARRFRIPLLFTYHTRYEEYLSYWKPVRWMEGLAGQKRRLTGPLADKILYIVKKAVTASYLKPFLRRCDYVFAPTQGMADYLEQAFGVGRERLAILPTGLSQRSFCQNPGAQDALRKRYGAEDCLLFLSVSRMSHEKNVEYLIHSLARMKELAKEKGAMPFRMLFVGDGPDREAYEALCRRLGLGEVCFTGSIPNEELADYYAAADAFFFASRTETQGIVLAEAFAGETPVYAVRASGVRDLVEDGINGRLFPEDRECFARGLLEAFEEADRKKLSAGAGRSAQNYREEAVARRAVSVYTYVCQTSAAAPRTSAALAARAAEAASGRLQ